MKKSVILAILGLSVAAVSSYGQGSVAFDTYTAQGGNGILTTYGAGPNIGLGIDNTFTGQLLWSATAINDSATTAATANNALTAGWNVGSTATFSVGTGGLNGYILGPNLDLTSGQVAANATIWFEIVAFNGTAWGNGTYQGHSASFTAQVATAPNAPTSAQMNNLVPFSVFQTVPEPTTMALGGLGLASLLLFRRKQA